MRKVEFKQDWRLAVDGIRIVKFSAGQIVEVPNADLNETDAALAVDLKKAVYCDAPKKRGRPPKVKTLL